jgi:hypothetical protein
VEPPPIFETPKLPQGVAKDIPPDLFDQKVLPNLRLVARIGSDQNRKYLKEKTKLGRNPLREVTVEDRINLSYFLIRLGQAKDARDILKPLQSKAGPHFMVFSNLATAYQMLADSSPFSQRKGQLIAAWSALRQAQKLWPKKWPGWTPGQLKWLKQVEQVQQKLIQLRLKDPPPKRGEPFSDVDHLFGFKFVGKKGQYGPGPFSISPKKEDVAVVQQLLTWLPQDDRLYWLFGELLNARGDVGLAAQILENCVWSRGITQVPELKKHRAILRQAAKRARPEGGPPGPKTPPPANAKESGDWLPGREQLWLVGGIGVLVIGLFGYLQFREIRRRRQRKTGAPSP